MGEVERRVKIGKLQRVLLSSLATGAVIGVAMIAPNALKLLKPFLRNKYSHYNFFRSLEKLKKIGLVSIGPKGEYFITDKGREMLYTFSPTLVAKPFKWDKKWRVIIFDIPKGRDKIRQQLRNTIQAYGFFMLQRSVWIYPYPCEDLITVMKGELKLGKQLIYMVVEALEGDKYVRDHFGL